MNTPDRSRLAVGTVDHSWRLSEISLDAAAWLSLDPEECRGMTLWAIVHPDDAPLLLLAAGRSGIDRRGVAMGMRVRRQDGEWTPVRCEVSPLCGHNPPSFALAMWAPEYTSDEKSTAERAASLEDHLWRIALEVAAAGIGNAPAATETWWSDPSLRDLSRRQLEILRRLLRGERVPTIARDLFLSQSTVRNHLSAIYRRLGVHPGRASGPPARQPGRLRRATGLTENLELMDSGHILCLIEYLDVDNADGWRLAGWTDVVSAGEIIANGRGADADPADRGQLPG